MHVLLIVVGLLGYVFGVFVYLGSPTIVQEIAATLIITNATLFFVGGLILAKMPAPGRTNDV